MHLVHTSTEKLSCHFFRIIIRNDALNWPYDGGLKGFLADIRLD